MLIKVIATVVILTSGISALGENRVHESPDKRVSAVIIPVGEKGYETRESRVEIRALCRRLLRWKSFASSDHNHGEGVFQAEWTSDGRFFVFNTSSSGGHQPWHVATYFYSRGSNKFYSLDAFIGPITSDFKLEGRNTIVATRFNLEKAERAGPVRVSLQNLRAS